MPITLIDVMRNEAITPKSEASKLKAFGGLTAATLALAALFGAAKATTPAAHATPAAPAGTASQTEAPPAVSANQAVAPAAVGLPAVAANTEPAQAAPAAPVETAPIPVAGLDQAQMNNAKKIVDTAKGMGLGERAQTIAIATAMQESNLRNLASTRIPESYQYSNGEGEGSDHDSVGLFQQRPNWGKTKELMTPETSARKFLQALVAVPGWDRLPLTMAAQEVQVSAYPDHYAKHEARATQIVDALNS
jgi:hypothetical protein